jgi:hypothetical protein
VLWLNYAPDRVARTKALAERWEPSVRADQNGFVFDRYDVSEIAASLQRSRFSAKQRPDGRNLDRHRFQLPLEHLQLGASL